MWIQHSYTDGHIGRQGVRALTKGVVHREEAHTQGRGALTTAAARGNSSAECCDVQRGRSSSGVNACPVEAQALHERLPSGSTGLKHGE